MPSARSEEGQRGSRVVLGRGRETALRRRAARREQQPTTLIATNGRSTEKKYFTALKAEPWVRPGKVTVVFENGSPLEVVRGASRRRYADDYDEAWVVCDVDCYDPAEPTRLAAKVDVYLLWSNPCFEVWLILHKADWTAHFDSASKCCEQLASILGGSWDKAKLEFAEFRDGVEAAIRRAKALGDPPAANPSTAVWRLVEALKRRDPPQLGDT